MKTALAVLTGILAAAAPAVAAKPIENANVELRLEQAAARPDGRRGDLVLEFRVREGRWQKQCRGHTLSLNQGRHVGTVQRAGITGGAGTLDVDVQVRRDFWSGGGLGTYEIRLKPAPDGKGLAGSYRGEFTVTEAPKPVAPRRYRKPRREPDRELPPFIKKRRQQRQSRSPAEDRRQQVKKLRTIEVSGKVTGQVISPWPGVVEDHVPVRPGEHPRLIFRKGELPQLKRLAAETPAGRAIMERFWAVVNRPGPQQGDKFALWPAVGYGFAYRMTGERKYARKAREIVERHFDPTGGQDIHHGPRLVGFALAFDLCCDGWDEAFRRKCVLELQHRTRELATGTFQGRTMGGLNMSWWSNHNGIRAAAAGLGALAILGEKNPDGEVMESARQIADQMAWEVRGYLRDGLGGGAWGMEGTFYRGMTMRRGLAQFIRAYPKVTGLKIDAGRLGDMLAAGYFIEAWPGKLFPRTRTGSYAGAMGIDGEPLPHIVYTLALPTAGEEMMPGVKYLLERDVGREGDKTYGIGQGFYAPFMLAGYPFDVQAAHPGDCFPWLSPDPRNGHWVFRPQWKDGDDILMTLNLQSRVCRACHYERTGTMSGWKLAGFGRTWIDGQYLPRVVDAPDAKSEKNGPQTLSWRRDGRRAVLSLDASPAYMSPIEKRGDGPELPEAWARAQGGIGAHRFDHPWGKPVCDYGIRARRALAVDCSGKSGAPLLVAIAEHIARKDAPDAEAKPTKVRWSLPLRRKGAKLQAEGKRFTLAAEDASLHGVVLGGGEVRGDGASVEAPDGEVLAVFTLRRGAPPVIKVSGEGLDAAVKVGERTVRFTEGRLRLE